MHVLIGGASGMIGTAVASALRDRGDTVTTLVRRSPTNPAEVKWDPAAGRLDPDVMRGVDAVMGFSGSRIAKLPWTKGRRRQIRESRVSATRTLATAINAARAAGYGPDAFLSASGVNAYGRSHQGPPLTEDGDVPGAAGGFLCDVVAEWEAAAALARESGCRVVHLRTGIVTGKGGAFGPLELMARLGVAGPLGGGRNVWPWISLRDEVAAILHALDNGLSGPVNLAGPTPATSGEIFRAVAVNMRRPYWLPAPRWALKVALGEAADELLLVDLPVDPVRLLATGFVFSDPTIEAALAEN